jgi:hypothetical protein
MLDLTHEPIIDSYLSDPGQSLAAIPPDEVHRPVFAIALNE